MSFVGSNILAGASGQGGGGGYEIERSLRFNSGDSAYLNRTPSATGNRKTWTWSGWVKFSNIDKNDQALFSADDGSKYAEFRFMGVDPTASRSYKLCFQMYDSGTITDIYTERVIRDPAAWYHLVLSVDFTKSTAAERVKIYVNSELTNQVGQGGGGATIAAQNTDTLVNLSGVVNSIGRIPTYSEYLDAYLADVHFIDGQALAPTDFGETDNNGVWQPKKFAGTYGPLVDQSQTWSSGMKTTTTANTSYSTTGRTTTFPDSVAATVPFDADLTNFLYSQVGVAGTWLYVEFGTALANVTSIVFSTEYSCPGGVIKLNGTDVTVSQSNVAGGFVEVSVTGTIPASLTEIAIQGYLGSARLKYLKINDKYLLDSGVSVADNSFHLDFADNSSNAALGTDTSGNSNTWTVNNLSVGAGLADSSTVWTSGDSVWTIASGGGSASMSAAGYADVFSGLLQTNKVYGFTTSWSSGDTNGGWFICDSNSTSLSGSHPNEGRGTNSIGQRGGTDNLGTVGSFSTANGVADGSSSITGFSDTNPQGSDTLTWVIDRKNHKAWVTHNGSSWVGGGNPTNTSSTPSFSLPSTGYLYFGFIQYTQMSSAMTITSYGVPDPSEVDSLIDSPTNGTQTDTGIGGEVVGNYATWNPLEKHADITLSNGNLEASTSSSWKSLLSTIGMTSGKWYWELTVDNIEQIGVCGSQSTLLATYLENDPTAWVLQTNNGYVYTGEGGHSYLGVTWAAGDIVNMAYDRDTTSIWFGKNGTWVLSGNPASGTNAVATNAGPGSTGRTMLVGMSIQTGSGGFINFGQRAFHTAAPAGFKALCTANLPEPTIADGSQYFDTVLWSGNNTARDISTNFSPDFVWTKLRNVGNNHNLFDSVRGVEKKLRSSANSAEATESGSLTAFNSDGFSLGTSGNLNGNSYTYVAWAWDAGSSNTTIAAGTSVTNQAQTWSSNITTTGNGGNWYPSYPATYIFDSTTTNYGHANGDGSVGCVVTLSFSPAVTCSANVSIYGGMSGSGTAEISINGGTAVALTSGSSATTKTTVSFSGTISSIVVTKTSTGAEGLLIYGFEIDGNRLLDNTAFTSPAVPSIASTVRANPSAGFSIVSYTGTGSATTVGHGLNAKPELIIVKNRTNSSDWYVFGDPIDSTYDERLTLNSDVAKDSSTSAMNATAPTSSVFTVGGNAGTNGSGTNIIAYCLAPVEGYSAMGSFVGNNTNDGPFVYTGFKPAFVMIKISSGATANWAIFDNKREGYNGSGQSNSRLYPNATSVEATSATVDLFSNGFKCVRATNLTNGPSHEYIYFAVAEHPFASNGGLAR